MYTASITPANKEANGASLRLSTLCQELFPFTEGVGLSTRRLPFVPTVLFPCGECCSSRWESNPHLARRRALSLDYEIISDHNCRSQACAPARKTVGYGQTRGPRTGFEPAIPPQGRCTHPECSRGHK